MRKINEWERDDAMHDYLQWQNELERLLNEDDPDADAIEDAKEMIAGYEEVLFTGVVQYKRG